MKKYILSLTRTNPWEDQRAQVLSIHESERECITEAERLIYAFTMRERDNLAAYALDKERMEIRYITDSDAKTVQTMHFGITEWDDGEGEPHENSFLQCTPESDCEVRAAIDEKLKGVDGNASLVERFDTVAKGMHRKFTVFTADEHDLLADEIAGALLSSIGIETDECRNVQKLKCVIQESSMKAAHSQNEAAK